MSKEEKDIDGMEKFNEKIYEDGITWLFGHHCLECGHLTFAQHEVKKLAKYFYELGYHQAREELIDKAIGWIKEINTHHHIMRYSDSCEPPLSELTEWFKNYMKEENINSK